MMTREMVMELLAGLGEDVEVRVDREGDVHVTVQDFEGFDEHYSEIERELDDEQAVDAAQEQLEASAVAVSGDYYCYYEFEGFTVVWGYESMDI